MKTKFKFRPTEQSDIPELLEIEFDRYALMYENNPAKKVEVEDVFRRRQLIAKEWMVTLVMDGRPAGFITGQPTNKKPEDFESWEKSTDNGTLERTFQPDGKNVYVVNLDVSRRATGRLNGHYMLMANLGGKILRSGKDTIMFESRMPTFRHWVISEFAGGIKAWNKLTDVEQLKVAKQYARIRIESKGKSVRYDKLLRFYEGTGFHFVKVLPNAFRDEESLDFGMLCTARNPIPGWLRVAPVNWAAGALMQKVGKSARLLSLFVG